MSERTRMLRILRLALSVNRQSKLKFVLLTALISIGALVFLVVAELSRASTDSLSGAIETDLGVAGTYRIEPGPDLQLGLPELLAKAHAAIGDLADRPITVAVQLPTVHPECPPYDQLGDLSAVVLLDEGGQPLPFVGTGGLRFDSDLCLAGLVVPRSSVREASEQEKSTYGASIVVDPLFQDSIRLTSTAPLRYTIVLTTGRLRDQSDEISSRLRRTFQDAALRASLKPDAVVVVGRVDSGSSVRAASDGIRLVYGLIGWGVMIVSGIGILVAELIVLRDRTWHFGLARAVGARRSDVALLVMADIVLILMAGFASAAVLALIGQPFVRSLGESAFSTQLSLLRLEFLPQLLLGSTLMLVLGGVYPAWRATRLDPLDVLERR